MTQEKTPIEALPIPNNGFIWSPITKKWYDKNGQPVY